MNDVKVDIERISDLPLLLGHIQQMNIQQIIDEVLPCHGNWQGLSPGNVTMVWLSHIISQGDHRMNRVEIWAASRLKTLKGCINQEVLALDFSDDRLVAILEQLSDDEKWSAIEGRLNSHTFRVYDLSGDPIRLDSTTASGYWKITEDGIFQLGHSKNHRPDLPQVKIKLSTLDPLGMPLATQILPGNTADDPLYIPAIKEVKKSITGNGLFYIGDCKMGALATRAFIMKAEDFYLCPLSALQVPEERLDSYLNPIFDGRQTLADIYRINSSDGEEELIANGFEKSEVMTATIENQEFQWQERRLIIRSLKLAEAEERFFDQRLAKAYEALQSINDRKKGKKRPESIGEVQGKVDAIMKKYRVVGLIDCRITELVQQRIRRHHLDRPEQVIEKKEFSVTATINGVEVEKHRKRLGWRVYATNQNAQQFSLEKAVLTYRDQYRIERDFARLKGCPLSLSPSYLTRDDHVIGLVRLLSICLRVLTLLEFVVRRNLGNKQQILTGLYPGNPKRATAHPTAEKLLAAFENIDLATVYLPEQVITHITQLSEVQKRILELLELPPDIYQRLSFAERL